MLLFDDKGFPSIAVRVPKATWAELGVGTSTEPFPAFTVNGIEVDALYFSKYENVVQNECAYAYPAQSPAIEIPFNRAADCCLGKGEGWHIATRLEQMAVSLWCLKNGLMTKGNVGNAPTGTGMGSLEQSHDRSKSGIYDLSGNIWEWQGGIRMVYGELQVISNDGSTFGNDSADNENSQSETSALWRAIDGTTGRLIAPVVNGTTPNSLKLDWIGDRWKWITDTPKYREDRGVECAFTSIAIDPSVCEKAKNILQALGLYKADALGEITDRFIANNGVPEVLFAAGGSYAQGAYSGLFSVNGSYSRSSAESDLGFRSCYIQSEIF
ncbi:MAG: hypothetical protein NC084_11835 [Bacteroides sp.]|nr:hypothetical protein [Bacteroides sp.]